MGVVKRDKEIFNILEEVCTMYVSTMPTEVRHLFA